MGSRGAQQLNRARSREWRLPPERETVARVPPLRGRQKLRRMLLVVSGVLLVMIPAVAFYLALWSGQ